MRRHPPEWPDRIPEPTRRRVFAAAHVAARRSPSAPGAPGGATRGAPRGVPGVTCGGVAIDWDATLGFRHHLWSLGFGVADAMDTAQRGMGLGWADTQELIKRSGAEAKAAGGLLACGAGTDHLPSVRQHTLAEVTEAYLTQVSVVADAGAQVILMASRALARAAHGPADYEAVYDKVLGQLTEPAILHWLGPMFDPALTDYWGSEDLDEAAETLLRIIDAHRSKVDGVKVSLLDAGREVALRRRLPEGVRLYTGDDFNYPELIRGDEHGHSDALLGVFAAIAAPAAVALQALDAGDLAKYDEVMAPTVPLARHIFEAPTYYYKTGVAFLAWLNGHQDEFVMLDDLQWRRPATHLIKLFKLAEAAGALDDPERAAARMLGLPEEIVK